MVVSRLVYFLDSAKQVLRIRATWMAKGFVSADMVCFAVQAIGGGLMAGGQDHPKSADLGKKIYMAGCGIQLACVVVFVLVAAAFYRRVLRDTRAGTAKTRNRWIQPLFWVIFLVLVLIVVISPSLFYPHLPAFRPHWAKYLGIFRNASSFVWSSSAAAPTTPTRCCERSGTSSTSTACRCCLPWRPSIWCTRRSSCRVRTATCRPRSCCDAGVAESPNLALSRCIRSKVRNELPRENRVMDISNPVDRPARVIFKELRWGVRWWPTCMVTAWASAASATIAMV